MFELQKPLCLPADLVTRLDQPRRRRQLASLAARNGTDERTARLNAAYGTLQFAARQTGGPSAPAWDARLDRYFEAKARLFTPWFTDAATQSQVQCVPCHNRAGLDGAKRQPGPDQT